MKIGSVILGGVLMLVFLSPDQTIAAQAAIQPVRCRIADGTSIIPGNEWLEAQCYQFFQSSGDSVVIERCGIDADAFEQLPVNGRDGCYLRGAYRHPPNCDNKFTTSARGRLRASVLAEVMEDLKSCRKVVPGRRRQLAIIQDAIRRSVAARRPEW